MGFLFKEKLHPSMKQAVDLKLRAAIFRRTNSGALAHTLLACAFGFVTLNYLHSSEVIFFLLGLVVLSSFVRVLSARKAQKDLNPQFLITHDVSTCLSSFWWSLLVSYTIFQTGMSSLPSIALFIIGAGVASSGAFALSPIPWLAITFSNIILVIPALTILVLHLGRLESAVSFIFLVYALFLTVQSKIFYKTFFRNIVLTARSLQDKQLTQTVLDSVPGFVVCYDRHFEQIAANKNVCPSLKNLSAEESPLAQEIFRFAQSSELLTKSLEIQLQTPEGPHWYLVSLKKTQDPEGLLVVGINIDDLKSAKQEIEWQKASMQNSSRLAELGVMAGGIAHEINNPLAIISGRVQNLILQINRGRIDNEKLKVDLTSVEQTSHRIAKIIRGLRSFARNSENDPLSPEDINIIIEDSLAMCQARLYNLQIDLKVHISEPDIKVKCRPAQLSQVLLNLLNNSVDAIEKLPEKWIRFDCEASEEMIRISITDSGQGIEPHLREKIMTPFFTTKELGKGTGLGLSISHGIMSSHQGKLYLDTKSKNTCFVIEIPRHTEPQIRMTS